MEYRKAFYRTAGQNPTPGAVYKVTKSRAYIWDVALSNFTTSACTRSDVIEHSNPIPTPEFKVERIWGYKHIRLIEVKPKTLEEEIKESKEKHPDKLCVFRIGDFYELFGSDAEAASKVLKLTLTTRQKLDAEPLKMCGFPYHIAHIRIAELLRAGHAVAVLRDDSDFLSEYKAVKS